MRSYFHCVTSRFGRRAVRIAVLAGSFAAEAAVILFMLFWFGLIGTGSHSVVWQLPAAAAAVIAAGLAVCVLPVLTAERRIRMHSRYTYADIQLKFAVLSRYDGIYNIDGERAVWRVLYYIPFAELESAEPSRNGKKIVITGRIREYAMDSDYLGYHVRNGAIEFDRPWLEQRSFTELSVLEFPAVFGRPQRLCDALNEAKKRFGVLPKPGKHVFRESEVVRRRQAMRSLHDRYRK